MLKEEAERYDRLPLRIAMLRVLTRCGHVVRQPTEGSAASTPASGDMWLTISHNSPCGRYVLQS